MKKILISGLCLSLLSACGQFENPFPRQASDYKLSYEKGEANDVLHVKFTYRPPTQGDGDDEAYFASMGELAEFKAFTVKKVVDWKQVGKENGECQYSSPRKDNEICGFPVGLKEMDTPDELKAEDSDDILEVSCRQTNGRSHEAQCDLTFKPNIFPRAQNQFIKIYAMQRFSNQAGLNQQDYDGEQKVFTPRLNLSKATLPEELDSDADRVADADDACIGDEEIWNDNGQAADGLADGCPHEEGADPENTDNDDDGILNDEDNCPEVANHDQGDLDNDGVGNACEAATDICKPDLTKYTIGGKAHAECPELNKSDRPNNGSASEGGACSLNLKSTQNFDLLSLLLLSLGLLLKKRFQA